MRKRLQFGVAALVLLFPILAAPQYVAAADVTALLARIKAVGREGAGNVEAGKAWRQLVRLGPEVLPAILAAFDEANATAANWLRAAADAIAERALAAGRSLPAAELEGFVVQKQHDASARHLAYEWLVRIDSTAPSRLLPGMLHDPSMELRRDAVALVLKEAQQQLEKEDKPTATKAFQKALSGARDRDQVDLIAKQLKALGVEVNLAAHFGLIQKWMLIGPFDSTGGAGFEKVYPPEKGVDLAATSPGKNGTSARWTAHTTTEPYGVVDLNKAIGKHMGAAAYAFAVVTSPTERPVQIRAGAANAVKIFLNGKQIFFREEYHHGMSLDQHIGSGTLRAGQNEILIKICQNEQTDDWAQSWAFQARVCDETGGTLPVTFSVDKSGTQSAGGKVQP